MDENNIVRATQFEKVGDLILEYFVYIRTLEYRSSSKLK